MASRCAYAVVATDTLDEGDQGNYWACNAERDVIKRRAFAEGSESINAVLVELTPDAVILAFRGTLPPGNKERPEAVLSDWGEDLKAELRSDPAISGQVHEGFDTAIRSTLDELLKTLKEWKSEGALRGKKIYITGHSKGGAMAAIGALLLSDQQFRPDAVYTFAAPRAGDARFKEGFDAQHINTWRYENRYDIVPHVPPNSSDDAVVAKVFAEQFHVGDAQYGSLGNLMYIDWTGRLTATYPELEEQRKAHFNSIGLDQIARIVVDAHSSGKGDGYGQAVCRE
jgi:hypothetical protein